MLEPRLRTLNGRQLAWSPSTSKKGITAEVTKVPQIDNKEDFDTLLPEIPSEKNGKNIALIGGGPASLTVARDLLPLGYEVTVFEKDPKPGGLMRTNIPSFRLPELILYLETTRFFRYKVPFSLT